MSKKIENTSQDMNWGMFNVSQRIVVWNPEERKFLFVKEADLKFLKNFPDLGPWGLIGGHIDEGETIDEAFEREIREEAGDSFRLNILGPIAFMQSPRIVSVSVIFLAEYEGGDIILSNEHSEYRWMTLEEIESEEISPRMKQVIHTSIARLKERSSLDDAKRAMADLENYKRRQKEREKEMAGFFAEQTIADIIPVLDNFQAATAHVPKESTESQWMMGITYIGRQLEDALATHGLSVYTPEIGDVFDPTLHEAVSRERTEEGEKKEDDENKEENLKESETKIVKVLQRGYKIGERVIRPAKVVTD